MEHAVNRDDQEGTPFDLNSGIANTRQRCVNFCHQKVAAAESKKVPEVPVGVGIAGHPLVALGPHQLLDLVVDEIVEGVNVLLHQASDLQEGRQQLVLVLDGLYGLGELGGVHEGLQALLSDPHGLILFQEGCSFGAQLHALLEGNALGALHAPRDLREAHVLALTSLGFWLGACARGGERTCGFRRTRWML